MLKWVVTAAILATFLAASLEADEPTPVTPNAAQSSSEQPPPPVKTGKERLSSKASDEQRVDNCKVPQELQGSAARPDTCEGKRQAIPTN